MRLLKTVLLSTTLLMSVVSAADFPGSEEPATAAHMEFQSIIEKSQTFEKTVLAGLLEIIELYNPTMHGVVMGRAGAEGLSIQDAFPALIEMIGIMESKAEAADSEVTVKAELNETLSKEKAAQGVALDAARRELAEVREAKTKAESALQLTREELEAGAAEKAQVEGQLEKAKANVLTLSELLRTTDEAFTQARTDTSTLIEKTKHDLDAEQKTVAKLTKRVTKLAEFNEKLTQTLKKLEADVASAKAVLNDKLDAKTQGINDAMAKLRADRAAKAAAAAAKK